MQAAGTACKQRWGGKGEEFHTSDQNNLPGIYSKGQSHRALSLKTYLLLYRREMIAIVIKSPAKLYLIEGENRMNFAVKDQSPSPQHWPYWSIKHPLGFKSSSSMRKNLSVRRRDVKNVNYTRNPSYHLFKRKM